MAIIRIHRAQFIMTTTIRSIPTHIIIQAIARTITMIHIRTTIPIRTLIILSTITHMSHRNGGRYMR